MDGCCCLRINYKSRKSRLFLYRSYQNNLVKVFPNNAFQNDHNFRLAIKTVINSFLRWPINFGQGTITIQLVWSKRRTVDVRLLHQQQQWRNPIISNIRQLEKISPRLSMKNYHTGQGEESLRSRNVLSSSTN